MTMRDETQTPKWLIVRAMPCNMVANIWIAMELASCFYFIALYRDGHSQMDHGMRRSIYVEVATREIFAALET